MDKGGWGSGKKSEKKLDVFYEQLLKSCIVKSVNIKMIKEKIIDYVFNVSRARHSTETKNFLRQSIT